MSFSTNLTLRPRVAAGCSTATNIDAAAAPLPSQLPVPHDPPTSEIDDLRFQIFINLTALNPDLGETATIHTSWHEGLYYSCVVDGEGRLRYTSLAQNSAEQSLSAVLRLVRGDVEIGKWEQEEIEDYMGAIEARMDEEQWYADECEQEDGDEVDNESEENDMDDESDEQEDGEQEEYDEMDMD